MSFHLYSKEILTEYLGTVAYVDDLIFSKKEKIEAKNLKIESPREMAAKLPEAKTDHPSNTEEKEDGIRIGIQKEQLDPNIDPVEFTNAFLKKGIHCSLFEIKNDNDSIEPLKNILKKSDVVILDWQMHQDNGRKASELLLSVIRSSEKPELRLFVIFTDDPKYSSLLSETIIPKLLMIRIDGTLDASGCIFKFGHSKIIVLEKTNGKKAEAAVSDVELPDRIIEEFTEITEGLVSNSALKAISVIRRNSHNLLGAFNKNLDSAYLAHRAMLPIPEDAEFLVIDTIVDSINSIISYSNISEACSFQKIEGWIEMNEIETKEIKIGSGKRDKIDITKEDLKTWQKIGYRDFLSSMTTSKLGRELTLNELSSFDKFKLKDKATECFSISNSAIEGANAEFAILTHHKSNLNTNSRVPYLTLGVVIQSDSGFFLCIQQKCDSLRMEQDEKRKFLFLPLNEEGSYPIIFKNESGEYVRLKVNINNCHYLQIKQFEQTQNGIVQANIDNGKYYFYDTEGFRYKWILDLKDSHAQRIANKFAAELSRVGLDESEWLRRN